MEYPSKQAIINLSTVSILCCSTAELAQLVPYFDDADIAFLEEFSDWARFKADGLRRHIETTGIK